MHHFCHFRRNMGQIVVKSDTTGPTRCHKPRRRFVGVAIVACTDCEFTLVAEGGGSHNEGVDSNHGIVFTSLGLYPSVHFDQGTTIRTPILVDVAGNEMMIIDNRYREDASRNVRRESPAVRQCSSAKPRAEHSPKLLLEL